MPAHLSERKQGLFIYRNRMALLKHITRAFLKFSVTAMLQYDAKEQSQWFWFYITENGDWPTIGKHQGVVVLICLIWNGDSSTTHSCGFQVTLSSFYGWFSITRKMVWEVSFGGTRPTSTISNFHLGPFLKILPYSCTNFTKLMGHFCLQKDCLLKPTNNWNCSALTKQKEAHCREAWNGNDYLCFCLGLSADFLPVLSCHFFFIFPTYKMEGNDQDHPTLCTEGTAELDPTLPISQNC